ncbi:CUE domain protein [Aspergillus sclerotialis]|uniref:CUE domain protein n=1 Tax=Aspergillus sclerotialis TaxID=2070753 RepID=A0A3A2ZZI1_9EURO|nr:CUE domain protein [Aspergillus sclerotialis]
MADLPPLIPVPPPAVRSTLPSEDWDACIDAWITLVGILVEARGERFTSAVMKDESTATFLTSFYQQLASPAALGLQSGPKATRLRKLCFLLTRRVLLEISSPPLDLLDWRFLGSLCCVYPSSSASKTLLSTVWEKHESNISASLEKAKSLIIKHLSFGNPSNNQAVAGDIRVLTVLASTLPSAGRVLVTGSDFLDTLFDAYQTQKREGLRRILVANAYVGLTSLLKGTTPNLSLLLDHLFSLKAAAGVGSPRTKNEPTLLSDLICSSDILSRLERYLSANPQKRGQDLVSSLRSYQNESKVFHHRYQRQRRNVSKGKGKARAGDILPNEELHAHKLSLITQIQDLFPDLGSGYIVRLLDFYADNTETVVAHLLDASLPPELQNLDRSEQLPSISKISEDPLPPHGTPPQIPSPTTQPTRKNIFDQDVDIAELARSDYPTAAGKLHFGRSDPDATADTVLADRSQHATNKAAILSALATFDSDDDERDDTYDVADVGGTVDSVVPSSTDAEAARTRNEAEEADLSLFRAYKSNPALFGRDAATRHSQPRSALKRETGMTDEAIEGWAVMLNRDPKRLSKLEDRLALSAGGPGGVHTQPDLPSTSYRRPGAAEESDEDSEPSASRGRGGGYRGRGRGGRRGGGGRGGGPPPDGNSAVARQRKEANKASRANHNRRQQRAKKIARGGGLPG